MTPDGGVQIAPGMTWYPPAPPRPLAEVRADVEAHNARGDWPPLVFTDLGDGQWRIVPDRAASRN